MKNRIDCRFRKSLGRAELRLTGTKILQKSDLVRSYGVFFAFPPKCPTANRFLGAVGPMSVLHIPCMSMCPTATLERTYSERGGCGTLWQTKALLLLVGDVDAFYVVQFFLYGIELIHRVGVVGQCKETFGFLLAQFLKLGVKVFHLDFGCKFLFR